MEFELGFTPSNLETALEILVPIYATKTKIAKILNVTPRQLRRYSERVNPHTMPHEKWLIIVAMLKKQKQQTDIALRRTTTYAKAKQDTTLF